VAPERRIDQRTLSSRWRQLSDEAKGAALVGFLAVAGASGLLVALVVPVSEGAVEAEVVETLTVKQIVTVKRIGKRTQVVVKRVPLVRTVTGSRRASTQTVVRAITTPGGERVVTQRRVVPVVQRELVTVAGRDRTVVEIRQRPVTRVVTSERVVTTERVVTAERTETQLLPVTQTVRLTETQVLTQTVTQPVTVTEQNTVTETVTVPKRP
jgi:hypothetical protein